MCHLTGLGWLRSVCHKTTIISPPLSYLSLHARRLPNLPIGDDGLMYCAGPMCIEPGRQGGLFLTFINCEHYFCADCSGARVNDWEHNSALLCPICGVDGASTVFLTAGQLVARHVPQFPDVTQSPDVQRLPLLLSS